MKKLPRTPEEEQERSIKNLYIWKNELQHNLPTPAQQNTRGGGETDPQITSWWEAPTKEGPSNNQKLTHTQSQHIPQPKISKLGRSRRLYH